MSLQTLIAVLIFSTVMAFTPGPNNAMLASSGARFGLARTLPHAAGVTLGFPVMIFLVGLGLASILLASPLLQLAMKGVSCAYLLWMAFQIARSDSAKENNGRDKPLSFLQAAAFQWINPKAWLMAVGVSAYTTGSGRLYLEVAIIAAVSLVVSIFSTLTWAAFGAGIRRWLRSATALRCFNIAMALSLVASMVPIMLEIAASLK
jgi:threonine/homoserine/homoserine lactone efflux protein